MIVQLVRFVLRTGRIKRDRRVPVFFCCFLIWAEAEIADLSDFFMVKGIILSARMLSYEGGRVCRQFREIMD